MALSHHVALICLASDLRVFAWYSDKSKVAQKGQTVVEVWNLGALLTLQTIPEHYIFHVSLHKRMEDKPDIFPGSSACFLVFAPVCWSPDHPGCVRLCGFFVLFYFSEVLFQKNLSTAKERACSGPAPSSRGVPCLQPSFRHDDTSRVCALTPSHALMLPSRVHSMHPCCHENSSVNVGALNGKQNTKQKDLKAAGMPQRKPDSNATCGHGTYASETWHR